MLNQHSSHNHRKFSGNFPNRTVNNFTSQIYGINENCHSQQQQQKMDYIFQQKWRSRWSHFSITKISAIYCTVLIVMQIFASINADQHLATSNRTITTSNAIIGPSLLTTSQPLLSADQFLESISGLYDGDSDHHDEDHIRIKRSSYKRLKIRHLPPVQNEPSSNDLTPNSRRKSANLYSDSESQPGRRSRSNIKPHLLPRILVPNFSVYLPIYGPSLYNINKIKLLPPIGPIQDPSYRRVSIPKPKPNLVFVRPLPPSTPPPPLPTNPKPSDENRYVRFHTTSARSIPPPSLPVTASESIINSDFKFQQPRSNQVISDRSDRGFVNFKIVRNITTYKMPPPGHGHPSSSRMLFDVFSAPPPSLPQSFRPIPTTPAPATKPYRTNHHTRKSTRHHSRTTTTTTTTTTTPAPSTEQFVYRPILTTQRPKFELSYEPELFPQPMDTTPTPSVNDHKRELYRNIAEAPLSSSSSGDDSSLKFEDDNRGGDTEDDAALYFDDFDNFDILRTEIPKKRTTNSGRRQPKRQPERQEVSRHMTVSQRNPTFPEAPTWRSQSFQASSTSPARTPPWQTSSSWVGHPPSSPTTRAHYTSNTARATPAITSTTTTTTTTTTEPTRWNYENSRATPAKPTAAPATARQLQRQSAAARTPFLPDPLWATKPIQIPQPKPASQTRTTSSNNGQWVAKPRKSSKKQDPLAAEHCTAQKCKLPNCNCGSSLIPGSLKTKDIPQLVMITFDDSINDLNWDIYREIFSDRYNPNGCPILGTFYVSHEWTDYSQVQSLYAAGHEMASHTITHSFGEKFSKEKWLNEVNGQREILNLYGGVKYEDVRGMRAPFLQSGGNNQYEMLYDANFTYDSSLPVHENNPPYWPYTFDYALNHECMIPPCPTRSYPGLWEFGMVMLIDYRGGRCSMVDACSHPSTEDEVYQNLLKNFYRHYESNKAPFGLYFHSAWFNTAHYRKAFMRFLDEINRIKDVYFVTKWQALQWVQRPTPLQRIKSFKPFHCDYSDRKPCPRPTVCDAQFKDGPRYLKTCQKCPKSYPWVGKTGYRKK